MNTQRSIAAYRHLTSLYPKSFRDEYRDDLVAVFTEQLNNKHTAHVWLFAVHDLIISIPSQHLEARMNRPAPQSVTIIGIRHWRAFLLVGIALLTVVLIVINVPPYNERQLPEFGWVLMMMSLVISIGLITVGITMGIAGRSARHGTTG